MRNFGIVISVALAAYVFGDLDVFGRLGTRHSAAAGEVKLVSDSWDRVCRVEYTWGSGAPNGTPRTRVTGIKRGWSITKPDALCYRRSVNPNVCKSAFTDWQCQESPKNVKNSMDFSLK